MPVEKISPILNVSNIERSFEWFEALGWQRMFTWNRAGMIGQGSNCQVSNQAGPADFAGVKNGASTLFLCQGGQGARGTAALPNHSGSDGVWMTLWLSSKSEVDELYQIALQHGIVATQPPVDEPWGVRECHLRHPDGHVFRLSCGLDN